MGLPVISVEFKKLATTALTRSVRGILAVVIQDTTAATWTIKRYAALDEIAKTEFTAANYAALARAFDAAPYEVIVIRVGSEGTMDEAGELLDKVSYNWVCAVPSTFQAGLVTYVKGINTDRRVRKAKALVYNQPSADDMHIVSVANPTVTLKGEAETLSMCSYLPRLASLLAALPMDRSCTYLELTDLDTVAEVSDLDTSIDGGSLCLFRDDDVLRIARGVNTLQTLTADATADMQKIAVVEAMDLIQEDIIRTFKNYYLGKRRNTADNQTLFVSDVTTYLMELASEGILNPDETVRAEIDIAAMRQAWASAGVSTTDMTDAEVKKKPFRAQVFVAAQARILDAMEDMKMVFTMG